MPDLALAITELGVDLRLENGDLVISKTLLEPVLVSLYSDARAPAEAELPDSTGDPRGWWGTERGDNFGSLIWLLERAKLTQATAVLIAGHARKALEWMIREGIASSIQVSAAIEREGRGQGIIRLTVELTRGTSSAWETAWEATREEDWSAERWRVNLLLR